MIKTTAASPRPSHLHEIGLAVRATTRGCTTAFDINRLRLVERTSPPSLRLDPAAIGQQNRQMIGVSQAANLVGLPRVLEADEVRGVGRPDARAIVGIADAVNMLNPVSNAAERPYADSEHDIPVRLRKLNVGVRIDFLTDFVVDSGIAEAIPAKQHILAALVELGPAYLDLRRLRLLQLDRKTSLIARGYLSQEQTDFDIGVSHRFGAFEAKVYSNLEWSIGFKTAINSLFH